MEKIKYIADAVIAGDDDATEVGVRQALDKGVGPLEIINRGLVAGLDIVGERFQSGSLFLPEMMLAAIAAYTGIEVVTEALKPGEYDTKATMVLGTVRGDVHDIGKNLVALVLRSRGFTVIDLGVDVSEDEFVDAVREHHPQFLGMSALLTTTMPSMKSTIEALKAARIRNSIKIVIGGAPLTQQFADEIGADGYGRHLSDAATLVERLFDKISG